MRSVTTDLSGGVGNGVSPGYPPGESAWTT